MTERALPPPRAVEGWGPIAGVRAALRTAGWLSDGRWRTLLEPAPHAHAGAEPPRGAVRATRGALRVLARVPGGRWRNTCLYRSVAECLVLRAHGVDARLRIGVGTEGAEVIAHAWVVRGAQADADADPAAAALRPLAGRA
ncbi:MAG TPA: lasso peptide biosynthesis B2 protein [Longimicrobium sp.]|jgi:hypothetical protein